MNKLEQNSLYALLPAIYRQRDAAQGEPLRALLAVIEEEWHGLTADIAGLYDNWFIESCDEWAVPYIGDLLGVRGLSSETRTLFSQRNYVANVLNYRRRKGVLAVLARVAQDVTGWRVFAVEYFRLLGLTQHLQFLYPKQGATVEVRNAAAMTWLDTPFDSTAHQVDVRRIEEQRGKHNLGNIGLFVWRLQSYPLTGVSAYQVQAGCFTFHPAGLDQPLFRRPQPLSPTGAPTLANLPLPLNPAALAFELAQRQAAVPPGRCSDPGQNFSITITTATTAATQLVSADLTQWTRPPAGQVAVDVVRGRIAFGDEPAPASVIVDYSYGFAADLGGGPYDRRHTLAHEQPTTWQIKVDAGGEGAAGATSLTAALAAWEKQQATHSIITITDNGVYELPASLTIPAGRRLVIQAADGVRPLLRTAGALALIGGDAAARLTLNGVLISAATLVLAGPLHLELTHMTLLPAGGDPATLHPLPSIGGDGAGAAQLRISYSRVGPLRLPDSMVGLTVQESIIDGGATAAIAGIDGTAPGPATTLERVTLFGPVTVHELTASEVIFTGLVVVQRPQSGMVRFSYVPAGSQTPQRYRCQPDLAQESGAPARRWQPSFTATDYREPAYAQLGPDCPHEITTGAENGSEMGVFHHLLQPQRTANLRTALDEYLPVGLEAGIFYMT